MKRPNLDEIRERLESKITKIDVPKQRMSIMGSFGTMREDIHVLFAYIDHLERRNYEASEVIRAMNVVIYKSANTILEGYNRDFEELPGFAAAMEAILDMSGPTPQDIEQTRKQFPDEAKTEEEPTP